MNKRILTSIIAITMCTPAMADIGQNATSATCDSATIGATSGDANLQAAWQANTINLDWYNGDTKQTSTTCQYDGTITLPSDPSPKTGYTFGGWQVRVASNNNNNNNNTPAQTTFDLSTWEYGSDIDYGYQNDSRGEYGEDSYNTETYGINGDQQWAVEFENGTVRGIASCNSTPGNENTWNNGWHNLTGNTQPGDTFNQSSTGQYCWCKATGVDTTGDGTYQSVGASSWVFRANGDAADCANDCANDCGRDVSAGAGFRRAVFGVVAQ